MPKKISPDDFYCPECNKKFDTCNPSLFKCEYSFARLDLIYFVCIDCGTCTYSKQLIRQIISSWIKCASDAKSIPREQIYEEAMKFLDEIIEHRIKDLGYHFVQPKRK
jgi:hypothetical protein